MASRRSSLAFVAALASSSALAGPAFAQQPGETPPPAPAAVAPPAAEPPPPAPPPPAPEARAAAKAGEDKAVTEEITVTGSRIRRKDLTTPAPITVISREQIAQSGKVTIGELLQALPEQGNAMNANVNNGGDGSTTVNLRSVGSNRTLVLMNGRRFVPGGGQADLGGLSDSVDLSSIPAAAVERLEVMKDGGSSLYGSDAIGGVVNIITRRRSGQTDVSVYTGASSRGDATTYDLSLTTGQSGERGSVLFSAGYFKVGEVMGGDREFSRAPMEYVYGTGTTRYAGSLIPEPGALLIVNSDPAKGGVIDCAAPGATQTVLDLCAVLPHDPVRTNILAPVSLIRDPNAPGGWRPMVRSDRYNFAPLNYLVIPSRRISLFSAGETFLGSAGRGYFEASYVTREARTNGAPEPLLTDGEDITISAQNQFNPFGVDLSPDGFAMLRRLSEFGKREVRRDSSTFRVVGGVDGTFPETLGPVSGWFWDVSLNYGSTQATSQISGNLNAARLASALGPSRNFGTDASPDWGCVDGAGARIPGCVPLNLFGGYDPVNPTITPAMVSYLSFSGTGRSRNEMTAIQANTSGPLFQLGDRAVSLAAGYEHREESGTSIPETLTSLGDTTGNVAAATRGGFRVDEGYAELSIPLLQGLPGIHDLEITGSARLFHYDTFGTDRTYKLGGRWRITPDVAVRGTWSTAFRAPSISDLYRGNGDSFPGVADPCQGNPAGPGSPGYIDPTSTLGVNCGAAANNGDQSIQLHSTLGGNPALDPETAKTVTAGIVIEPRFVKGLSVTVDYYRADIDNAITTLGEDLILASCYPEQAGKAPKYCGLVTRATNGRVTNIDNRNINVGGQKVAGLDFAARYALPTRAGRFTGVFDGTWLLQFNRILADGSITNERGNFDFGNLPDFKFNAGVTWGLGGLGAGVSTRYMGHLFECSNGAGTSRGGQCDVNGTNNPRRRQVAVFNSYDLFASYALPSGLGRTNLSVGVQNVFDEAPPFIYSAFAANTDSDYPLVGRFFYVRLAHVY